LSLTIVEPLTFSVIHILDLICVFTSLLTVILTLTVTLILIVLTSPQGGKCCTTGSNFHQRCWESAEVLRRCWCAEKVLRWSEDAEKVLRKCWSGHIYIVHLSTRVPWANLQRMLVSTKRLLASCTC
jgi:hypothetical protein